MARTALVIALLSLLHAGTAHSEIFRWTDDEGVLHFTHDLTRVPPEKREQARRDPPPGTSGNLQMYSPPASVEPPEEGRSEEAILVPFVRRGTLMWVDATVNDRRRVPFLVDTGASGVSLPSDVVAQLGIPIRSDTPRMNVNTANGMVRVPVVRLDSVQLGDARVEGLLATVNPNMDVGLLGGSFFNNFKYSVDIAAGVIALVPNEGVRGGAAADQWRERFAVLEGKIARLEAYLGDREITRPTRRAELEASLAALKEDLRQLEIEANQARVPKAWRH